MPYTGPVATLESLSLNDDLSISSVNSSVSNSPISTLSPISSSSSLDGLEQAAKSDNYTYSNSSQSSLSTIIQSSLLTNSNNNLAALNHNKGDVSSVSSSDTEIEGEMMPRLIRKKSGELVKSSLKLNSLYKTKSLSNLKSVRFATRLENFKYFNEFDKPLVVSTENSPENSVENSPRLKPNFQFEDQSNGYSDESADDSEDDYEYNNFRVVESNLRALEPSFDTPVRLQSLNISNSNLVGIIKVVNLSFQKFFQIKISIDNWNSNLIIENVHYLRSFNNFDYFKFNLNLSNFIPKKFKLDLCVKYVVNSTVFWDNNNNKNYSVVIATKQKRRNYLNRSLSDTDLRLSDRYNFGGSSLSFNAFSAPSRRHQSVFQPSTKFSAADNDSLSFKPKYSNSYKLKNDDSSYSPMVSSFSFSNSSFSFD